MIHSGIEGSLLLEALSQRSKWCEFLVFFCFVCGEPLCISLIENIVSHHRSYISSRIDIHTSSFSASFFAFRSFSRANRNLKSSFPPIKSDSFISGLSSFLLEYLPGYQTKATYDFSDNGKQRHYNKQQKMRIIGTNFSFLL